MGVRAFNDPNAGIVYPSYGVHFEKQNPNSFIIFADTNNNNQYNGNQEKVEEFILSKATIADLCVETDSSPPGRCGLGDIDIVYARPDPIITIKSQGGNVSDGAAIIESFGKRSSIIFWISNQVYVKKI